MKNIFAWFHGKTSFSAVIDFILPHGSRHQIWTPDRCLSQGIPLNMTGVASLLKRGGYQTHLVGKWDVGMATEAHHPRARGYDSWLGYWHHTNDSRTLWWAKPMGFIFWRFSECFACFPIVIWDVILSWCFLCAKFCSIIRLGKAQDYWQHTESKCGLKKMKDLWIYNSTYDGPAFHLQILEQNMRFESCE